MNHKKLFRFAVIPFLGLVAGGASAQTMPSAKFLLTSWKSWSSAFKQEVHSYQMTEKDHTLYYGDTPANRRDQKTEKSSPEQITIRDGKRFRYHIQGQNGTDQTASYDGTVWYYRVAANGTAPQLYTMTKAPIIDGSPITSCFQGIENYPLTIEQFLDFPWYTEQDIPLYEFYLARLPYVQVLKPETIGQHLCYHLHLDDAHRPDGHIPNDIWMTAQGRYFIPWLTQMSEVQPNGVVIRGSFLQHEGKTYHDIWYPNGYDYRIEMQDSKKSTWEGDRGSAREITLSNINNAFPVETFQIQKSSSEVQFLDDRHQPQPVPKTAASILPTLLRGLLALTFLTLLGLFLRSFWRRPPHTPPPSEPLRPLVQEEIG